MAIVTIVPRTAQDTQKLKAADEHYNSRRQDQVSELEAFAAEAVRKVKELELENAKLKARVSILEMKDLKAKEPEEATECKTCEHVGAVSDNLKEELKLATAKFDIGAFDVAFMHQIVADLGVALGKPKREKDVQAELWRAWKGDSEMSRAIELQTLGVKALPLHLVIAKSNLENEIKVDENFKWLCKMVHAVLKKHPEVVEMAASIPLRPLETHSTTSASSPEPTPSLPAILTTPSPRSAPTPSPPVQLPITQPELPRGAKPTTCGLYVAPKGPSRVQRPTTPQAPAQFQVKGMGKSKYAS
ncbi:hypothetical protein BDV95DRAFT_623080 [Massariosphaeria phaeospora]|uniref:Uncharacterized protein n=1 Tax=Massariosphaeria phaeospora TaxID=100035 RepID=A0A7C8MD33_9PLEO|nr:hypothetical protein BDV95DRAFT_623080 [Massariosphaeria phaeospora]